MDLRLPVSRQQHNQVFTVHWAAEAPPQTQLAATSASAPVPTSQSGAGDAGSAAAAAGSGGGNAGDMLFLEVCEQCLVLRGVTGTALDRWWLESLLNMTYCPKTRLVCFWRKHEGRVVVSKFYTKKVCYRACRAVSLV